MAKSKSKNISNRITERDIKVLVYDIIDCFEDMLDEKDITIPDIEREGNPDEGRIYGITYYDLEDSITDVINKFINNKAVKIDRLGDVVIPESLKKKKNERENREIEVPVEFNK